MTKKDLQTLSVSFDRSINICEAVESAAVSQASAARNASALLKTNINPQSGILVAAKKTTITGRPKNYFRNTTEND